MHSDAINVYPGIYARDKSVIHVDTSFFGLWEEEGIEWRLANGVPFAVIFSLKREKVSQAATGNPAAMNSQANKIIVVIGLSKKFELQLDGSDPMAIVEARRWADTEGWFLCMLPSPRK